MIKVKGIATREANNGAILLPTLIYSTNTIMAVEVTLIFTI